MFFLLWENGVREICNKRAEERRRQLLRRGKRDAPPASRFAVGLRRRGVRLSLPLLIFRDDRRDRLYAATCQFPRFTRSGVGVRPTERHRRSASSKRAHSVAALWLSLDSTTEPPFSATRFSSGGAG